MSVRQSFTNGYYLTCYIFHMTSTILGFFSSIGSVNPKLNKTYILPISRINHARLSQFTKQASVKLVNMWRVKMFRINIKQRSHVNTLLPETCYPIAAGYLVIYKFNDQYLPKNKGLVHRSTVVSMSLVSDTLYLPRIYIKVINSKPIVASENI